MSRKHIRLTGSANLSKRALDLSADAVSRMGILDRLRPRVDPGAFSGRGIPKGLLLDPFMVLGAAQATDQGHTGRLTAITQAANGLSQEQRDQYEVGRYNEESGHRDWHALGSYDKVDREFNALAKAMVDPPPDPDTTPKEVQLAYWRDVQKTCDEYMLAGCIATLPPGRLGSYSVDIDGTAIKTPAKSKYRKSQFILDGDDGGLSDEGRAYKEAQQKAIDEGATNWKDLVPKGPDDRAIWAPGDPTARGGWHSATNKEPAGPYNGYELHLGVLGRNVLDFRVPRSCNLGPPQRGYIAVASMVPANTHRGEAIAPQIVAAKRELEHLAKGTIRRARWDPGYSLLLNERSSDLLKDADIVVAFKPASHQTKPKRLVPLVWNPKGSRGRRARERDLNRSGEMPWLKNGWPIWSYTPEEWVKLRVPAMNDTKEQKKYLCDLYDHLAKFRLIPTHTYPDGRIQFSCPCCAGRLKVMNGTDENGDLVLDGSENDEAMAAYEAMRAKAKPDAIEVYLPEGVTQCCRQPTVVLHPEEIPDFQDMFPFSTGWTIDMNNRNLVENVNGRLKAQNSQANSNYAFVLGLVKLTIVYTFLLMGHNILIQLKQEEEAMLEAERQRREMAAAAAAARAAQNPPRRNHWGSRARARSRASPVP